MAFGILGLAMLIGLAACEVQDDPTNSCPPAPLDIHLVVDTSISIKDPQFKMLRIALVNFVEGLDVGPGDRQVRVALAGFGGVAERYFDFDDFTDKGEIKDILADMQRVAQPRGTETGLGIGTMMGTFSGDMGERPNAKDISVIFTDGRSTNVKSLAKNLEKLAQTDITQYAVGIGKGIQHDELLELAQGEESRLVQASSFDALLGLASTIADEVSCICSPVCKRGECVHASGICKCPVGWVGDDCNEKPVPPATCEPACVNGECNKDTLKCECDEGFRGEDCSKPTCVHKCLNGDCNRKTFKCDCDRGFTGDDCSEKTCARPCDHGTCDLKKLRCRCEKGWKGQTCNKQKPECKPKCINGKCNKKTKKCKCNEGWTGDDCGTKIPACKGKCVHGTCNQKTEKCDCDNNYKGPTCKERLTCEPTCVNGKCNLDTLKCECEEEYTGADCSQTCKPKCKNGRCNINNLKCVCDEGYTGADCSKTCEPGCVHGTCNTGTLQCECDDGYSGVDCSQKCGIPDEMELMLAIDISNSLNAGEYAQIRRIARTIVDRMSLGFAKTRVAVCKFGFRGVLEFGFGTYGTATAINAAIDGMKRQPFKAGYHQTRTSDALNAAAVEFNNNARPGIDRKIIVITDGVATDEENLPAAVQNIKAANVDRYAMAIGDFMKPGSQYHAEAQQQLGLIAGDQVFTSLSFNLELVNEAVGEVLSSLDPCSCKPRCVHGTCNPKTISCECEEGWIGDDCATRSPDCAIPDTMELMLAIDISNSLNAGEYAQIRRIAKTIVNRMSLGFAKTRVAVCKFGFRGVLEFGFGTYGTATAINAAIDGMKRQPFKAGYHQTRTSDALNAAAVEFNNNARPGIDRKIIVITDGVATDEENLPAAVQNIKAANVDRYAMAIGDFMKPGNQYHAEAQQQLGLIAGDQVFTSLSFNLELVNNAIDDMFLSLEEC